LIGEFSFSPCLFAGRFILRSGFTLGEAASFALFAALLAFKLLALTAKLSLLAATDFLFLAGLFPRLTL
jgi:hypothetical protein